MRSRRTPDTGLAKTSDGVTSGASEGGPEGLRREDSPGETQRTRSRSDTIRPEEATAPAAEVSGRRPHAPAWEGTCLIATSAPWKSGARWLSVALLGGVALGYAGAATPKNTNAASASTKTYSAPANALDSEMRLSAPHKLPAPP
ncbi:MAG TPA: hypothetical protein VHR15_11880, partial [Ktedonobacterales bacterium]|nr:hypothetical protein [Ktedonobacterales bacterium]